MRSITVYGETVVFAQWKGMRSFLDTCSSIATTPSWSSGDLLYSRATVTWVTARSACTTATLCLRSKRTSSVFGSIVRYKGKPTYSFWQIRSSAQLISMFVFRCLWIIQNGSTDMWRCMHTVLRLMKRMFCSVAGKVRNDFCFLILCIKLVVLNLFGLPIVHNNIRRPHHCSSYSWFTE